MKPVVLQLCPLSPALDQNLQAHFRIVQGWGEGGVAALPAAQRAAITGIATAAPVGVPDALFDVLPHLRVISCRGVGLDRIDLERARARCIQVSGTFGLLEDCVADLAFGLLLDIGRRITEADRFVRAGDWEQARFPLAARIHGRRLGIVGLGGIGSRVARRAAGFDLQVRYTGRQPRAQVAVPFEPSLEALARWSDFLVVTVSGGAATRHLISGAVLEALGPQGYLINVSRGSVVDTQALIGALVERRLAGAALDVFDQEPHVPAALRSLDNVVLTPHIASATHETRAAMEELTLANLRAYYTQGAVLTPA